MTPTTAALGAPVAFAASKPTIKGIFVNSHVERVARERGPDAVRELERRVGMRLRFGAWEDVPVREEVRIIEHALDLLEPGVAPERRAFEAGRLHFRNFTTTPWGRMLFALFPRNLRYMMQHAEGIADKVFRGVRFTTTQLGPNAVRVVMENNDYPIDHFKGLFHEWMLFFGLRGHVIASETAADRYEYVLQWEPA